jgi:hypothetical protein
MQRNSGREEQAFAPAKGGALGEAPIQKSTQATTWVATNSSGEAAAATKAAAAITKAVMRKVEGRSAVMGNAPWLKLEAHIAPPQTIINE